MMMEDSLFLLISNVLGRGCGAREGAHSRPSNDVEGFFVSAYFKMFKEGGVGLGRRPTNDDEGFFVFADFNVLGRGCGAREGAQ